MRQLISQYILDKYTNGERRGRLPAAALFVDLSGFSAMTEQLSRHGDQGAEILADVMTAVFEPLVNAVYSQGGFVLGYAGDAFTAVFCEDPSASKRVQRALASAVAIQKHIQSRSRIITEFGEFIISIKSGVGAGDMDWFFLKSAGGKQATYCVRGTSVDRAVAAEECAPPGGIILDPTAFQLLDVTVVATPIDDCQQILGVIGELPEARAFAVPEATMEKMAVFLPEEVLGQYLKGEFRQVVNLFIEIPINPSDDTFVAPFMESVFFLQERYGGFFHRPEMGDKGFTLLVFWGAPNSHENDIDRALNFLLELRERTRLRFRAGITYRMAYAGFMGAALREEYTAYGLGVNLASRMMKGASPGEVWMDEEIFKRAQRHFHTREVGVRPFKGFTNRVKVFALVGRKGYTETAYKGEFVGREQESRRVIEFLEPLTRGEFAGLLLIKGDAGIGKSRLVHSVRCSNFFLATPAQWVVCQADEVLHSSLNTFSDWLMHFFRVSDEQSAEVNRRNFAGKLQDLIDSTAESELATELVRTASVLAALLNIEQPGSLYDQLDAKGRYDNTLIALSVLLRACSLQKPLVLLMEDLQWLDGDTRAFLPYLIRTSQIDPEKNYPIAILATSRGDAYLSELGSLDKGQQLELGSLSSVHLRELAQGSLGGQISWSLLQLLEQRSEGNPLFAEQLLRYFTENNMILRHTDGQFYLAARPGESIPTDVRALLIARLDRLTREVRNVVQTASVLGREFEVRILKSMLADTPDLATKILQAEEADIWFPLNDTEIVFQHALLWKAAYSMQLVTHQRELHKQAVSVIETLYAGELGPHFGVLAYHAEQANSVDQARSYLIEAGRAATHAYQNALGIDYFSRALLITPATDIAARFNILKERSGLYGRTGDRVQQLRDLAELEELATRESKDGPLAQLARMRASYEFVTGNYQEAARSARKAIELADFHGETSTTLESYSILAISMLRQSQLKAAIQIAQAGLALAQSLHDRLHEGILLNSMGMIAIEGKDPASALDYLEQALGIAREIKETELEIKVANQLGNVAGSLRGDFSLARRYYEQAIAIVHQWGDRYAEGLLLSNLAWVMGMQGDLGSARVYHQQALIIAREIGNPYQEAYTLINLSSVAAVQGDSAAASETARQAYDISRKLGDHRGVSLSLLNLGHAMFQAEEFEQARNAYARCIEVSKGLELPGFEIEPMAGLLQVALQMGDTAELKQWTGEVLARMENGALEGAEEPLRVYHSCYEALLSMKDPRANTLLQDAASFLQLQISKIPEESARDMFVNSMPWRRAIWNAWEAIR